ncbi:MAG: hypothetical protein L6Q65_14785 [Zoogloea sp.]|nr:hypothetical protein [Zoogloea sp.]
MPLIGIPFMALGVAGVLLALSLSGVGLAVALAVAALLLALGLKGGRHIIERRRAERLQRFAFPPGPAQKVRQTYPHLDERQVAMVMAGLRDYFSIVQSAGRQMVAMPSQAVDVAWHEFILFTRGYQAFCSAVLGRFLHHTPAEHMGSGEMGRAGLRRAWLHACRQEGIDPKQPDRLPRLFAIDALLAIPDGFRYDLDCARRDGTAGGADSFCASDFGCGTSGCGGDGGDAGDGGDGGGGCGGD